MRTTIYLFCLILCLSSCQDKEKKEENDQTFQQDEPKDDLGTSAQDQPINQNRDNPDSNTSKPDSGENDVNENPVEDISGVYLNTEHSEDSNCNCYCIDVKTNGTSELCLTEDKLYINGRFEKSGNNINIYYSGKTSGTTDKEIPWDEFETGTPIAVLSPAGDGSLKLDWKGFSIDGQIAIDYALFGKKTLEGTYKKK